jgi:hypothetical protein
MNPEIENLINMALADGVVTEKERAIILRKAVALGEDKDEVEMILDGRIALLEKEKTNVQQTPAPKSNKEGDLKKCPSCGAPVQSFNTKCSECSHEFRGTNANHTISGLFAAIQLVKQSDFESQGKSVSWAEFEFQQKIASIISGWPIPNTKEDILEFLSQALPEATKKIAWIDRLDTDRPPLLYKKAWATVCNKIIMKARFSMKDDKSTLAEIEHYAKELGVK